MTPSTETSKPPRPRCRLLVLGLAVTTGLLISGCGSGDDSSDASGAEPTETSSGPSPLVTTSAPANQTTEDSRPGEADGDTCDIVSDEVASEVLGIEIERREPHTDATGKSLSCIKGTKRVTDMSEAYYVSVSILPAAGSILLDQASSQADSVPVSGLGDEAVYLSSLGALLITESGDGIQVQVVKAGKPAEQQDAVTVAEDVLDRRG
jgi:hypothetical protein